MAGKKHRGVSGGTKLMLVLTCVILVSFGYVWVRLGSGQSVDLSKLNVSTVFVRHHDETDVETDPTQNASAQASATPRSAAATPNPTAQPNPDTTLTFGGVIAVEENVRKSGYASDTKKYDFSEFFSLIGAEIQGSVNGAFLENLVIPDGKVSTLVIPDAGAEMMKSAGFDLSFSGFGKAWEKDAAGIQSTRDTLMSKSVYPLGLCGQESDSRYVIRNADGIRAAFMQYSSVSDNTRKSMTKKNAGYMIPAADPEIIRADIQAARADGAQAVIVLLNWGKAGDKSPDKSQVLLAQQIADLGADIIIGAGSRVPQKAETLIASDGRQVLCAYSLGTLISDNRKSANRMGGYLLHVRLTLDSQGKLGIPQASYTPTYVWKYRQDGKDYYRIVAADRPAPDGMDSDQSKQMQKTLTAVQNALEGAPVALR